ncbi:MAG TPA: ABC transporter substrate-binding protein, partial [Candidatus Bathyarchaeia archaeon]|nr:ABC transporter substrate-binding protein [Candidatus Bathyarchaeia archaeon]
MRINLKISLFLALSCFAFSGQTYAQSLERINAIYASIAGDHAGLYVAQEMGLFRKYGLEVNLSYTAGAAQVIQTMMAGENQIATAGGSGVVDADFAGADLVAVAGMVNIPAFYIVVQPEIKSIQELRGRPVGITRFGSSTDFTMRYILRKAGLEPDRDVPLLQLGGQPELAAGIETRRIFAAPMTPPALLKTMKAGARIQIPPKTIGLSFPHVGIVVRKQFLTARRQTVKNFIAGYSEGVAMLYRDKEGSKSAIARF